MLAVPRKSRWMRGFGMVIFVKFRDSLIYEAQDIGAAALGSGAARVSTDIENRLSSSYNLDARPGRSLSYAAKNSKRKFSPIPPTSLKSGPFWGIGLDLRAASCSAICFGVRSWVPLMF